MQMDIYFHLLFAFKQQTQYCVTFDDSIVFKSTMFLKFLVTITLTLDAMSKCSGYPIHDTFVAIFQRSQLAPEKTGSFAVVIV